MILKNIGRHNPFKGTIIIITFIHHREDLTGVNHCQSLQSTTADQYLAIMRHQLICFLLSILIIFNQKTSEI